MQNVPQFGDPKGDFKDRPGSYAVIQNELGQLLTVVVRERFHLPGGGIDNDEDPEAAVRREILEETGYTVGPLEFVGQANQFLQTKDIGPVNKLGQYFKARISNQAPIEPIETDHELKWVTPDEFLTSTAHDFHKWAVGMVKTQEIA